MEILLEKNFIQDVPRGMPTLVSLRDQRWKEIRHILTPTYSLLKLKGVGSYVYCMFCFLNIQYEIKPFLFQMTPIISECVDLFTNILKDKSDVDIYEYYQGLTLDVISRCALALQLDCQRNPQVNI